VNENGVCIIPFDKEVVPHKKVGLKPSEKKILSAITENPDGEQESKQPQPKALPNCASCHASD